jgi:Family of unknown function (DUF6152)
VKRKAVGIMAAVVLLAGGSTYAHHSSTTTYDESKTVTIEGELVQFMFRNPHAWVHVMAPDDEGVMQRRMRSLLRPSDGFGWASKARHFD